MNLFGKEPRPVWNNSLNAILFEKIARDIHAWDSGILIEEAIEDCEKVFKSNYLLDEDAYIITKEFEDQCGYSPDSWFVHLMDNVAYYKRNIIQEKIKLWVKTDLIKPEKHKGESVQIKLKDKIYTGQIINIDESLATYTVNVLEMNSSSTSGYVINYEDIIP